ncbi:MAG: RDD family protein [Clostridiales bacterium]|nr:RDD family protein [Clostridiales bacterium]MBR6255035.1 RDD family protein [Clostridiales bacterium]MCR5275560.1 RDD family protein [Clostridiales bacterium]
MNTNASMVDRFCAVFLDLITFLGFAGGVAMLVFSASEINTEVEEAILSRDQLIKLGIVMIVSYFVLDILLVRLFATTPGKLAMNCDVDFHMGNSMIYCILRSFFKIICLFTVIPGLISYVSGSGDPDSRTWHDRIAKTNVTNSTRMPRFVGVLTVLAGIALLIFFIITYRKVLGLNFRIGLSDFKIFSF